MKLRIFEVDSITDEVLSELKKNNNPSKEVEKKIKALKNNKNLIKFFKGLKRLEKLQSEINSIRNEAKKDVKEIIGRNIPLYNHSSIQSVCNYTKDFLTTHNNNRNKIRSRVIINSSESKTLQDIVDKTVEDMKNL